MVDKAKTPLTGLAAPQYRRQPRAWPDGLRPGL